MISVYLSEEAQDALLEEFDQNGLPESQAAEWSADILLEPIEACMSIRCQKTGEGETYLKKERFFPLTVNMRESETITVADEELEGIRDQIGAFLDGELEVPGIPMGEERAWLRNSVLYFRLVTPYVRKHMEEGSYHEQDELAGIYIFCEESEIRSQPVVGKNRPELYYARLTEDGTLAEEVGRYYEDELFSLKNMKRSVQELANRPQYLDIDGDGNRAEWPPSLLEEYQCGRLQLDGRLKKEELKSEIVPVTFTRKDFLWQRKKKSTAEKLYVTVDTLMNLPEVEIPIKRIPKELLPEVIVEIVDAAFTCIIESTGENLKSTHLSLYCRFGIPMLSPVYAEAAGICEGAKHLLEDGRFGADGEGYLGDVAFSLLFAYKKLLGALIASDWFAKHGRTENAQSGILVECDGETVTVRRVTGPQRPELICSAPENERFYYRPYQEDTECTEDSVSETVRVGAILDLNRDPAELLGETLCETDIEKEISQGNPQAMKLRAQQILSRGSGVTEKRQALALYEKAFELLPDDDDLEFEIFMLKMDLNDQ